VLACAAGKGMAVSLAGSHDDLELAVIGHGATVVVLDADTAPRRRTRAATAFASAHPGVPVLLAATSARPAGLAGLPLVGKASADALLQEAARIDNDRRRE
jgi:hypothetical protein